MARSVPDARLIADKLVERGVKLTLGTSVYDPTDPMGKMFFNILATFAEFEADLIQMCTREGMAIARAKGKLRGQRPKLSDKLKDRKSNRNPTGISMTMALREAGEQADGAFRGLDCRLPATLAVRGGKLAGIGLADT